MSKEKPFHLKNNNGHSIEYVTSSHVDYHHAEWSSAGCKQFACNMNNEGVSDNSHNKDKEIGHGETHFFWDRKGRVLEEPGPTANSRAVHNIQNCKFHKIVLLPYKFEKKLAF